MYIYKVRAEVIYKKDEKGDTTKEIELVKPIGSFPFVGDVDAKNEWYIVKTPTLLPERDDVIRIEDNGKSDTKRDAIIGDHKVTIDKLRKMSYGGVK